MGNLLHFLVMTFALLHAIRAGLHNGLLIACAIVYAILTVSFGLVVFGSPETLNRNGVLP